jgi:hypothetical protein
MVVLIISRIRLVRDIIAPLVFEFVQTFAMVIDDVNVDDWRRGCGFMFKSLRIFSTV